MNRLIVCAAIIAGAMLFAVPGHAANISCGASIDAAISANPAGTVFQLAGTPASPCTYSGQTFHTKSNVRLLGGCAGQSVSSCSGATVLDGGCGPGCTSNDNQMTDGFYDSATGVIIDGVTIQNYTADWPIAGGGGCGVANTAGHTCNAQFVTWNGWTVRNSVIRNSGSWGAYITGSGSILNSLLTNNRHGGIGGNLSLSGTDTINSAVISGNEISNNNTRHDDQGDDASGLKILGNGTALTIKNNYVHDNLASGLWCDGSSKNWTIQGNTIINNATNGVAFETCNTADIAYNVINHNGQGPYYGGGGPGMGIFISSSANANVHDNNVLVPAGNSSFKAIQLSVDDRPDAQQENNVTFSNNTVSFSGTSGGYGYKNGCPSQIGGGSNCSGPTPTGISSNNNAFYMPSNTSGGYFYWGTGNGDPTASSFSSYQSSSGQDVTSKVSVGNVSVAGCTHIGCTGSGWPVVKVPESPFAAARSITSTISAVDYDLGGQGLAFSDHQGACGAVPVTTYRTDSVYIDNTTDSGSPYKIGCQEVGDYYNYTVSVTTAGMYKVTMRVANVETGASYHIAIDGKPVVSGITVPNTGAYTSFATVSSTAFSITAGQHIMTVGVDTVGSTGFAGDFHWIQGMSVSALSIAVHAARLVR
jgi:hypothetical protein